jgi:hypothetical protein
MFRCFSANNADSTPNVNVLLQYTDQLSKQFDDTLGADMMLGPRSFDLDFENMTLNATLILTFVDDSVSCRTISFPCGDYAPGRVRASVLGCL